MDSLDEHTLECLVVLHTSGGLVTVLLFRDPAIPLVSARGVPMAERNLLYVKTQIY